MIGWADGIETGRSFQLFIGFCVSLLLHIIAGYFVQVVVAGGSADLLANESLKKKTAALSVVLVDVAKENVTPPKLTEGGQAESKSLEAVTPINAAGYIGGDSDVGRRGPLIRLDALPQPEYIPPLDREFMRDFPDETRLEVRLEVDVTGEVRHVDVLSGSPVFAPVIQEALRYAKFKPGKLNGRAVSAAVTLEIVFPKMQEN